MVLRDLTRLHDEDDEDERMLPHIREVLVEAAEARERVLVALQEGTLVLVQAKSAEGGAAQQRLTEAEHETEEEEEDDNDLEARQEEDRILLLQQQRLEEEERRQQAELGLAQQAAPALPPTDFADNAQQPSMPAEQAAPPVKENAIPASPSAKAASQPHAKPGLDVAARDSSMNSSPSTPNTTLPAKKGAAKGAKGKRAAAAAAVTPEAAQPGRQPMAWPTPPQVLQRAPDAMVQHGWMARQEPVRGSMGETGSIARQGGMWGGIGGGDRGRASMREEMMLQSSSNAQVDGQIALLNSTILVRLNSPPAIQDSTNCAGLPHLFVSIFVCLDIRVPPCPPPYFK